MVSTLSQRKASFNNLNGGLGYRSTSTSDLKNHNFGTMGGRASQIKSQIMMRQASQTKGVNDLRVEFIGGKVAEKKDLFKIIKDMRISIIQAKKAEKTLANDNIQSSHDVRELKNLLPAKEKKIEMAHKVNKSYMVNVKTLGQDCAELNQCKEVLLGELRNEQDLIKEL